MAACVVQVTAKFMVADLKVKGLYFYLLNEEKGLPITVLDSKTAALSKCILKSHPEESDDKQRGPKHAKNATIVILSVKQQYSNKKKTTQEEAQN